METLMFRTRRAQTLVEYGLLMALTALIVLLAIFAVIGLAAGNWTLAIGLLLFMVLWRTGMAVTGVLVRVIGSWCR
jgi:Flp pilus assembly pilin Flp